MLETLKGITGENISETFNFPSLGAQMATCTGQNIINKREKAILGKFVLLLHSGYTSSLLSPSYIE
jgi:hypothetical protein